MFRNYLDEIVLINHLCNVFTNMNEYIHGFTESYFFSPERYSPSSVATRNLILDLKQMFEDYVYYKIQYLKAKKGKLLDLRSNGVMRKESQRFLTKDYSKEDVLLGLGDNW